MTRLDDANRRLNGALDRLERALEQRPGEGGASAAADEGLSAELESLREALDASRRENASLKAGREAAADRVDETIDRLKNLLGD